MSTNETASTSESLFTPNSSMDQITTGLVSKGLDTQKAIEFAADFEMKKYFSEQNERFLYTRNLFSKLQRYREQSSCSLLNL